MQFYYSKKYKQAFKALYDTYCIYRWCWEKYVNTLETEASTFEAKSANTKRNVVTESERGKMEKKTV